MREAQWTREEMARINLLKDVYQSREIQPKLNTTYKGLFNSIKILN
jgi:hypothetical protein